MELSQFTHEKIFFCIGTVLYGFHYHIVD